MIDIGLNDTVQMRKKHPCGGELWTVTRTGADIKIKCLTCERIVMLDRPEFEKRMKKIVARGNAANAEE